MNPKLTHTCDSLTEQTQIEITALLQEWLADSIDLMMQAKQALWNVKDRRFNALHLLFSKIYTDAGKYVDLIAGRIAQMSSWDLNAKKSSLVDFPLDIARGKKDVSEQSRAITFYLEIMRKANANFTQPRDVDNPTKVSCAAVTELWFVETHQPSEN